MTTWQEQMSYDIRLVWDNDYDTYNTIQVLIDEADGAYNLSLLSLTSMRSQ
jgi:CTP:phosphocholine cytidylyltransferase-like protein